MSHRNIQNGIFTTVAVALSGVALAGLLCTDAYSRAAGAEARGFHALSLEMQVSCAGDCAEIDQRIGQLQKQEAVR